MSRMNKKAQVTIAIILAVILILAVSIILYLRPSEIEGAERALIEVPEQARPIASYIQDCVESVATPGVYLLGAQGGYVFQPYKGIETMDGTIAYGYFEGKKTLPSITEMEIQLSSYMANAVAACANFSEFEKQGFEIKAEEITTETTIARNNVVIMIEYPVTVKKGNFETKLDTFGTTVPVRLGQIYDTASSIISKETENPDSVDITFISDLGEDIAIITHDESQIIYSIKDAASSYRGDKFIFLFGNKFKINLAPELDIPNVVHLKDGMPFVIYVKAKDPENDTLTFSDDTALFDISPRGLINITPEVTGEYNAKITVWDTKGNSDSEIVKFLVEE